MTKSNLTAMIHKDPTQKILCIVIKNHRKTTNTEISKIKGKRISKTINQIIDILKNAKDQEIKKIVMTLKLREDSKNKNIMTGKTHTTKTVKKDQEIKTLKMKGLLLPRTSEN